MSLLLLMIGIHRMLNNKYTEKEFAEKIGCIEIQDNVFVGSDTKIMYDVRIDSNVVIASGSIVTKDIPSNTTVAGIPAKPIGKFDEYVEKRRLEKDSHPIRLRPKNQHVEKELADIVWEKFESQRK
ncbi:acyltransferase [Oceanobacillus locisalsi]|uniref:Acyltransferase n=1 Tax=Oceanobacillus locisalsi TaxID=546107 RepID=A0ABW3N9T0_9BACI